LIEVNLLPRATTRGRTRQPRRELPSVKLPRLRLPAGLDRWTVGVLLAWLAGPFAIGWMLFGARAESAQLETAIERARADSAQYAGIIEATRALQAQRDTIAQKLAVIQEIDAGRYLWAHILEEISLALPDYTWLTGIAQTSSVPVPHFRIEGRTGNNIALTQFMRDLEASPFIRGVRLSSTHQIRDNDELVYAFMLEAGYEEPPADVIRTVALFPREMQP
jgi:Tfp pilus assembly protein PilN